MRQDEVDDPPGQAGEPPVAASDVAEDREAGLLALGRADGRHLRPPLASDADQSQSPRTGTAAYCVVAPTPDTSCAQKPVLSIGPNCCPCIYKDYWLCIYTCNP